MPDYRQRFAALVAVDRQPIRAAVPDARETGTTAVLRLYDPIDSYGDMWGVSAKEFAAVLDELPDTTTDIRLLVNSPGGEVFEGIAILNLLRSHPAKVTAVVEGIAASAASFIACGVDETVMAPNSEMFVHNAWGLCVGDTNDMQQMADELAHISENVASIYAQKAGGTTDEWRQTMSSESWYSADEAVAAGLADRVDTAAPPATAEAKARFDLSVFSKFSGRRPAPVAQHPAPQPAAGPTPPGRTVEVDFTTEQLDSLRQQFGLAADADENAIRDAALQAALTPPKTPETPTLPDGVVAVDAVQLADLRADAAAGREARAQQLTDARVALVNGAVQDGRIPPARKDAWLAQLEADPGAEQVLAGLAKGLVPVAELGSAAGDLDISSQADRDWEALYGKAAV